jgi:hypothetical protein
MGSSLFSNDMVFDIFALNATMGKTFFVAGCWLPATGFLMMPC